MDNHPRQYSIRSRTGLYPVLICHIFSDWSGTENITSRLMQKHTHTYKTQSCNHRVAERCWTLMHRYAQHVMHNKHGQPQRNARSEAELACIWCLSVTYFQTGAAQKSSRRDSCTNTLARQHENTLAHKHKNLHNRRTTLYNRL